MFPSSDETSEFFLCIWTSDPGFDSYLSDESSILVCANTDDHGYDMYVPIDVAVDETTGTTRVMRTKIKGTESGNALQALLDEELDAIPVTFNIEVDRIDDMNNSSISFSTRTAYTDVEDFADRIFPNMTGVYSSTYDRFGQNISESGELMEPVLFDNSDTFIYMKTLDFDPRFVVTALVDGDTYVNDGMLIPYECVPDYETRECTQNFLESYWKLCLWSDIDSNYALQCSHTTDLFEIYTIRPLFGGDKADETSNMPSVVGAIGTNAAIETNHAWPIRCRERAAY